MSNEQISMILRAIERLENTLAGHMQDEMVFQKEMYQKREEDIRERNEMLKELNTSISRIEEKYTQRESNLKNMLIGLLISCLAGLGTFLYQFAPEIISRISVRK